MQFKRVYYYKGPKGIQSTSSGIVLIDSKEGAEYYSTRVGSEEDDILQEITLYTVLHPLFIDIDLCGQTTSREISQLLYEQVVDNKEVCNYDGFIDGDDRILKDLATNQEDLDFQLLGKFLNLKGFNCIIYPIFDIDINNECCIIWDTKLLKNIKEIIEDEI